MPAHGSSHHGWRIITDNAGSRQLTPLVENNSHTMPAHGSSHHGWRTIETICRLTAALTTDGEQLTHNAGSRQLSPRVSKLQRLIMLDGSRSRMFRACICKYYMSTTDLTYPWNLYITKYFTVNVHAIAVIPYKASSTLCNFLYSPSHRLAT